MPDLRKPGNPGGTRGSNNAATETAPCQMHNTDSKAPGGHVMSPEHKGSVSGRKGNPVK